MRWLSPNDPISLRRHVKRAWRWAEQNPYCASCQMHGHYDHITYYVHEPIPGSKTKSKRRKVRRKRHQGEHQELGFEVKTKLKVLTDAEVDVLLVDLLDFLHQYGLCFGGGFTSGFISAHYTRGVRTPRVGEGHRQLVREWLEKRPEFESFSLGELTDAWYGPFSE
jgi:uncharacterized protein YggL (DUF469 family)